MLRRFRELGFHEQDFPRLADALRGSFSGIGGKCSSAIVGPKLDIEHGAPGRRCTFDDRGTAGSRAYAQRSVARNGPVSTPMSPETW